MNPVIPQVSTEHLFIFFTYLSTTQCNQTDFQYCRKCDFGEG
jgi:hypothetical protein